MSKWWIGAGLVVSLVACTAAEPAPSDDALPQAGTVVTSDGAVGASSRGDAASDASFDGAPDAEAGAGDDATADAAMDAADGERDDATLDAGTDAGVDAASDTGSDAGIDAPLDAAAGPGTDAGVDAAAGTETDAGDALDASSGGDATTASDAGGVLPPPSPPGTYRIEGRYVDDPEGPKLTWAGTKMTFRFVGTSITVTYRDDSVGDSTWDSWYEATVDGKLYAPFALVNHTPPVSDLTPYTFTITAPAAGDHVVTLQKRTEEVLGVTQILGFDRPLLALPPETRTRRFEFIGDSLTVGYGIESPDIANDSSAPYSETNTYGALTAKYFNALHQTIACSGRGLVHDFDGNAWGGTMVDRWQRVQEGGNHPYNDGVAPMFLTAPWDFSRFQPDVVTVNLGTNDFTYGPIPLRGAFASFFRLIRSKYPGAFIIGIMPSLPIDANRACLRDELTGAIADVGDPKLSFLEFPNADPGDGQASAGHPSLITHQKQSLLLIAHVKALTGWQ